MFQRLRIVLASLSLLAAGHSFVHAGQIEVTPSLVFTTDGGDEIDVPFYMVGDKFFIGWENENGKNVPYTYTDDEFSIVAKGTLDPDPSIAYGVTVTDLGAPSTFTFTFTTPIVPTGPLTAVSSSITGGLTDTTGNGVSITPLLPDADGDGIGEIAINEVFGPATNMGVDIGPGGTYGPGGPGALYVYGPFTQGPQNGPTGLWTGLQSTVSFQLSGGGDVVSLTGFASVENIPEPSTVALLAMGAMSVVGRFVLRRRAKA